MATNPQQQSSLVSQTSLATSLSSQTAASEHQKVKLRLAYGGRFVKVRGKSSQTDRCLPRRALPIPEQPARTPASLQQLPCIRIGEVWACLLAGRKIRQCPPTAQPPPAAATAAAPHRAVFMQRLLVLLLCLLLLLTSWLCSTPPPPPNKNNTNHMPPTPRQHTPPSTHDIQGENGGFKFVGGEYFNESVPYGISYSDFMFKRASGRCVVCCCCSAVLLHPALPSRATSPPCR